MSGGNKGEWSEPVALFGMLSSGILEIADGNLVRTGKRIIVSATCRKNGNTVSRMDIVGDNVEVFVDNRPYGIVPRKEIEAVNRMVIEKLSCIRNGSNDIEEGHALLKKLGCETIKGRGKTDIYVTLHDDLTNDRQTMGFSIKSRVGNNATLLNASKSTNFTFRLDAVNEMAIDAAVDTNGTERNGKRMCSFFREYTDRGISFRCVGPDSKVFGDNLDMISTGLDRIVGEMLKLHFIEGINDIYEQCRILSSRDPLNVSHPNKFDYYSYKIKKLLTASALGMVPGSYWNGKENANGGFIIVLDDGDLVCIPSRDRNEFEEYLLRNTVLETPSTTRHEYSDLYTSSAEWFVKLNLQIRFK